MAYQVDSNRTPKDIANSPVELHHSEIDVNEGFFAHFTGSRYPYLDMGNKRQKMWSSFKAQISAINPFAVQQGQTYDRVGYSFFNGTKWFAQPQLPTNKADGRLMEVHLDQERGQSAPKLPTTDAQIPFESGIIKMSQELLPLVCYRKLDKYERCKMFNNEQKCKEEELDFLQTCPNPALQELRKTKLTNQKHRLIQLQDYRRALEVSEYNKGRTVADVDPKKTYIDGTAKYLRPDSMWADERYANVTKEEILAARERLGEAEIRKQSRINPQLVPMPEANPNKQNVIRDDFPVYSK